MLRLPGWLVIIVFLPLQIFFAIKIYAAYGFWTALGLLIVLGMLATRAASPHWFRAMFFPHWAGKHERRRHVFQGILLLLAALTFVLAAYPQPWVGPGLTAWVQKGHPWLPLALATSLVKSAVR